MDDHTVRPLVTSGSWNPSPGTRAHRFASFAGTTFTTTVRVIDRVHGNATNRRTNTTPAHGAGLANLAQAMFFVADFANGGAALDVARRTSPERRRTWAYVPSRAIRTAEAPAEQAIWAPLPGIISMQWIVVPTGMLPDRQGVAGADRGFDARDQRGAPLPGRAGSVM